MGVKPEDHLIGTTLEKCRITGKLGAGGMGSVYLAEHFALGKKVAVKILPSDMSRDPEYVARFMREATTAGRLEHPNIVQIYDVGFSQDRHFIVMQYVDGESLATVVDNLGAMEPKDAAKVARGILRGLHHAHQHGVVHRDVKPDNILVAQGDEPKILDFGLAIETEASLHITRDGMVVGTPFYLSPEQARGLKATPQSDVYATGVTLYYLLTGKRPFTGATALAVLNKHIHEAPVPPASLNPKIPKPLNDIVLKMLAKKKQDRYATAAAAAEDLDRFLGGREIGTILTFRQRLEALPRKQKILAASGAGAAALLVLILLVAALIPSSTPAAPPSSGSQVPGSAPVAENPQLMELLKLAAENKGFDMLPEVVGRFDAYIESTTDAALVGRAKQHRQSYIDSVEQLAVKAIAALPPETEPLLRLRALDALPRGIHRLPASDRLPADRARLVEILERRYLQSRQKLAEALASADFAAARRLIDGLLEHVVDARRKELEAIRADLPRLEEESRHPLAQAYVDVRRRFEERLVRRESREALLEVTKFLKGLDAAGAKGAKVDGLNYAPFLSVGDDVVSDQAMGEMRGELAAGWAQYEETLPFRILSDLQDVVDVLWLVRRSYIGLQTLERSRADVTLASLGGAGKVVFGQQLYAFRPRSGKETAVKPETLPPADLAQLAAAADESTPEKSFETSAAVTRAVAAAYVYSKHPDRWSAGARWYAQAVRLRTKGPPGRLQAIREAGSTEVRDGLIRASKEKFAEARRILSDLAAAWGADPAVGPEISRALASAISAEIGRLGASNPAQVAALGRELRQQHAGRYDAAAVDRLVALALLAMGEWSDVPTDVAGSAWTWEGKPAAQAPAEDGRHLGFRPLPGGRLTLAPVRAHGTSGISFSVRIDEKRRPFAAGVEVQGRRILLQDPGQVVLREGDTLVKAEPLDGFRVGQWIDLTMVFDAGEVFCYQGKRPLFNAPASVPAGAPVSFLSDIGAYFRNIRVRK